LGKAMELTNTTTGGASACAFIINSTTNAGYAAAPQEQVLAVWKNSEGILDKIGLKLQDAYSDAEITFSNVLLIFKVDTLTW